VQDLDVGLGDLDLTLAVAAGQVGGLLL
jgi:hypothetical protein